MIFLQRGGMKKAIILTDILLLVVFAIVPTVTCETTDGNILYVNGSGQGKYSTIQSAIDNASEGDTIFVFSGIYYENIVLDKSIFLIGEEIENSIMDGSNSENVITITADKVTIRGFTIQNSGDIFPDAGINISSDYNNISGNIITNNFYGITLIHASNNIISENTISNNDHCGIYMSGSSYNIINGNTIEYHHYNGIGMYDSTNTNTITDNTLTHNDYCGINIAISSNNEITGNSITDSNIGIRVPQAKYQNHISDNIFSNNKNNIVKESGMVIYELIIVIIILVCLTAFILFWKEKSQKKITKSKDTKHYLDARGNPCPIPLIMTKKKIAKMKKGEILEIITTDFVAKENIERFGKEKYELIRIDKEGEIFKIFIKK